MSRSRFSVLASQFVFRFGYGFAVLVLGSGEFDRTPNPELRSLNVEPNLNTN